MNFIFIRHSKTDRNPAVPFICWGLTAEGIELAEHLSQEEIIKELDVLYSSSQTKALETALYLAKPNGISIKVDPNLTEVTSFTIKYDADIDIYTKNVHDFYSGAIDRINGGETKAEALDRFNMSLEAIAKAERGSSDIGIVTHGNILALFTAQYKDVDCLDLHYKIKQPDVAVFNWKEKRFMSFFGE